MTKCKIPRRDVFNLSTHTHNAFEGLIVISMETCLNMLVCVRTGIDCFTVVMVAGGYITLSGECTTCLGKFCVYFGIPLRFVTVYVPNAVNEVCLCVRV